MEKITFDEHEFENYLTDEFLIVNKYQNKNYEQ